MDNKDGGSTTLIISNCTDMNGINRIQLLSSCGRFYQINPHAAIRVVIFFVDKLIAPNLNLSHT